MAEQCLCYNNGETSFSQTDLASDITAGTRNIVGIAILIGVVIASGYLLGYSVTQGSRAAGGFIVSSGGNNTGSRYFTRYLNKVIESV